MMNIKIIVLSIPLIIFLIVIMLVFFVQHHFAHLIKKTSWLDVCEGG